MSSDQYSLFSDSPHTLGLCPLTVQYTSLVLSRLDSLASSSCFLFLLHSRRWLRSVSLLIGEQLQRPTPA